MLISKDLIMRGWSRLKGKAGSPGGDEVIDEMLTQWAHMVISERLKEGREKGYSGWWNEAQVPSDYLRSYITERVEAEEWDHLMVYAAMLHIRETGGAGPRRFFRRLDELS